MPVITAKESIEQLMQLSSQLNEVVEQEKGDLNHIFIKATTLEKVFEPKPKGIHKLWHMLKRLFTKENYSLEKSLISFQRYFYAANSISDEEYGKLQLSFGSNIESTLNELATRLETIQKHVIVERTSKHKSIKSLEAIRLTHLDVEERRLDRFEARLKSKLESLLQDPDADYSTVLNEFMRYADETIPAGVGRTDCNNNFKPKIEALQKELQETIRAYVMGSLSLFDSQSPEERKQAIATLRTVIAGAQDLELHKTFETAIASFETIPTTTQEKTEKAAATIPLISVDNLYKTLGYVAYDLCTKGSSGILSVGYILALGAPTLALHLYNQMVTKAPSIASKKSFVITYLTQILAKSAAPYITKKIVG